METDSETTDKVTTFVVKATNVPPEFFEKRDVAKRYFRRFGKVKLVMFKPKRNALLIEYTNEDGMLNALEVAGEYNGHFFHVDRDTEAVIRKKKPKKNADPDWTDDPDVRAELEAMGAFGPPRSYDLRSDAMAVDPTENQKAAQRRWKGATGSPKPIKKKATKEPISGEHLELTNLIKQQALTVEDKFRILDARDKLIRIKMKKNIELSKAKATVGTCPDMCPEKERLMRETQHQVALYEQEEDGKAMNHRLAVKQYSRSSADQEAPLPQELRPVSVLQMTMGYLMHRIMNWCDTPDVNISEWYHFLWDRTRGIRKDITQQELCCQGSVELVEQCARFHIFCSARLVAEDPSVFDQKINTENLTKCLQTLKYMYHDLQLKGESCKNEPEFRAYIILLNLNDGNFMWEVQQLKTDIQQSKEVKFALEVYSSLDKRNYVKFFKLVNSTTFLNACILMRYFIQVRLSAITTLLKSYSPRVSQASLPVHYLSKILGFESAESAIDFFEAYGLDTDVERTRLILNKNNFTVPEYPYILDRAIKLVESKRHFSIGEVVCGKDLPPKHYETHLPQNSFDKDGFLKCPELYDLITKEEPMKIAEKKDEPMRILEKKEEPMRIVEKKEEPPRFSSPITVQVSQAPSIFAPPKPTEHSRSIFGQASIFGRSLWAQPATTASQNIFGGVTQPIFAVPTPKVEVPKIEVEEEDDEEEENERKRIEEEREKEKRRLEEEEERRIEEERRREEERRLRMLREEEEERRREEERRLIRKKQEEQKKREQEKRKNLEIKAAVCGVISELLDDVEENMKQLKLAEIKKKIHERKLRKIVAKWRENTRRKRKRKAIDFSPQWFGGRTVEEEADELRMKGQNLALESMKRYKRGKPCEIQINEDEDLSKIDLTELTYKLLRKKFLELEMKLQCELFWKVTISLPNESEFPGLNHIERALNSYIKWEKRGSTTVVIEQSKSIPTITYCLEKQKGFVVSVRNDTNGFVFIANDLNEDLTKRVVANFKNYGSFVKVPIVLVLQTYTEQNPYLAKILQGGVISDYLILVDKFTSKNLINLVEEALIFLSTRLEKAPPLELDTLRNFLLKYLCSNMWKRANSFSKWNSNYKDCLKNPNTVIYLHNEAVDRLKKIILNKSCKEFAKFPDIFKEFLRSQIPDCLPCDYKYFPNFWDCQTYLQHVEEVMNSLHLPKFLENWPPNNQVQLELSISKYCQMFKEPQTIFYKVMALLLKNCDPGTNFKEVGNIVWTDVVEALVLEKLNETDFSLYGTGFVNKSVYNQLVVVYDVTALNSYVRSDWFYVNHPIVRRRIEELLGTAEEVCNKENEVEELDLDEILARITKPRNLNVGSIKNEISSCKKMLSDLEDTVVIHRKILETSSRLLHTIIEEK